MQSWWLVFRMREAYRSGEKIYPSVTDVCDLLAHNQDALMDWANRTTGWREVRDTKASIGTLVHELIARDLTAVKRDEALPGEPIKGRGKWFGQPDHIWDEAVKHIRAWRSLLSRWCEHEPGIRWTKIEERLISDTLRLGGTPDLIMTKPSSFDTTIYDFKTSKQTRPSHWLQLAGYSLLVEDVLGIKAPDVCLVVIGKRKDSYKLYKQELLPSYQAAFLSLLDCWHALNGVLWTIETDQETDQHQISEPPCDVDQSA